MKLCGACNGSGEGMHDGSRCTRCEGSGLFWNGDDDERDEYDDHETKGDESE